MAVICLKSVPKRNENGPPSGGCGKARSWSHETGFALYCLGIPTDDIGAQLEVSGRTIRARAQKDGWEARADQVRTERETRGAKLSKEQEFIRQTEMNYARRLFGLAEQMIRTPSLLKEPSIKDLVNVLELASTLGRRAMGLPMNPTEVAQTFDIGEHLQAMIDRAYGKPDSDALKPVADVPVQSQIVDEPTDCKPIDVAPVTKTAVY